MSGTYRQAIQSSLQGGGSTSGDVAHARLSQLLELEMMVSGGDHLSNPDQERAIEHLLYDTSATIAIIEGQYRDAFGGDAFSQLDLKLRSAAASYRDTHVAVPFLRYVSDKVIAL
jgi:hypothetical protein